jgi:hypothetical protein
MKKNLHFLSKRRFANGLSIFAFLLLQMFVVPSSAQVAEYLCDETSGEEIINSKGGESGVFKGEVSRVPGQKLGGLEMAGAGFVNAGKTAGDEFSELTLSAWIQPAQEGDWQGIIMHGPAEGMENDTYGLYLSRATNKGIGFKLSGTTSAWHWPANNDILWDGQWHMLTAVYDGSKAMIYIDGKEIYSAETTGKIPAAPDRNLIFGSTRDNDGEGFYYGKMDGIRIYDKALSVSDIEDLMKKDAIVEKIKGGSFLSTDLESWTLGVNAEGKADAITFGNSTVANGSISKTSASFNFSELGLPEMQMYQKVELQAGVTYTLSGLIEIKGNMRNNWCQLYIGPGNILPDNGNKFTDAIINVGDWAKPKCLYLEAWEYTGADIDVDISGAWPIAMAAGTKTNEFTPEEDGTYIVLFKINLANSDGPYEIFVSDISLKGAESTTSSDVEDITVTGGTEITTDGGTLQMTAVVEPSDANQSVKWVVENGTGEATISAGGLLTAIKDGTVLVKAIAKDGTEVEGKVTVTISGQTFDKNDLWNTFNEIANWNFDKGMDGAWPKAWGGWVDKAGMSGTPNDVTVEDGVAVMQVGLANDGANWHYQLNQQPLSCEAFEPYIFKFKTWANADGTPCVVDFEDTGGNNYNRYGTSTDPESNGSSEWAYTANIEPMWYTFHVVFDKMVENTVQKVQWMNSLSENTIYLDSVQLIKESDLALKAITYTNTTKVKLYPNPVQTELTISKIAIANSKVSVYNAMGQKLMEKTANGTQAKFDVASLRKGMYFVRFSDGTSEKFMKQ